MREPVPAMGRNSRLAHGKIREQGPRFGAGSLPPSPRSTHPLGAGLRSGGLKIAKRQGKTTKRANAPWVLGKIKNGGGKSSKLAAF